MTPALPPLVDDGACDHLVGRSLPSVRLASTVGPWTDAAEATRRWTVIYVYPSTGVPGRALPAGWDTVPGARGCTPQSCSYRDDHARFQELGVEVYGLSTQSTEAQHEFASREHIPFPLLSDPEQAIGRALDLPVLVVGGVTYYRRVTLVVHAGEIVHVRYPVATPDRDAVETLAWLGEQLPEAADRGGTTDA